MTVYAEDVTEKTNMELFAVSVPETAKLSIGCFWCMSTLFLYDIHLEWCLSKNRGNCSLRDRWWMGMIKLFNPKKIFAHHTVQISGVFSVSASASRGAAKQTNNTMLFSNYQWTKENPSPRTDNICVDSLYEQFPTMKCASLETNFRIVPKLFWFRNFLRLK